VEAIDTYIDEFRDVFRPRQTRQLHRAVYLKGAASKLSKLLITTTPFHSLFSLGATTPIGGCILQPSSGL